MSKPLADSKTRPERPPAKFVTGSLLRHILVMTGAGAFGLMAIFAGDFANIYFLGWLKDEAVIAAVGYGSAIVFFTISIGIGLSIAASALVSPAVGAGQYVTARRLSTNAHLAAIAVAVVSSLLVWLLTPALLSLMGASGRTLDLAIRYLNIIVPSLPFLASAMTSAAVLRSVGDARRAMNITVSIAVVNTLLDPVLIYWMGLGIDGAAIASTLARLVAMGIGFYGVTRVHNLMGRSSLKRFKTDVPRLAAIAVPAVLTNIASPVANGYVTAAVSAFGDSAVAGWTVIGRIVPLAFGAIYASVRIDRSDPWSELRCWRSRTPEERLYAVALRHCSVHACSLDLFGGVGWPPHTPSSYNRRGRRSGQTLLPLDCAVIFVHGGAVCLQCRI